MATQEETQKIYEVIEEALLSLCQEKPNDPVDYLSRKMLQLIGEDPTSAIRKKNTIIEGNVTENIVLSPDKIAIQNLKKLNFNALKHYFSLLKRFKFVLLKRLKFVSLSPTYF